MGYSWLGVFRIFLHKACNIAPEKRSTITICYLSYANNTYPTTCVHTTHVHLCKLPYHMNTHTLLHDKPLLGMRACIVPHNQSVPWVYINQFMLELCVDVWVWVSEHVGVLWGYVGSCAWVCARARKHKLWVCMCVSYMDTNQRNATRKSNLVLWSSASTTHWTEAHGTMNRYTKA